MNAVADRYADRWSNFEAILDISALIKGGRVAANWLPDGSFWFIEGAPDNVAIKRLDPATGAIGDMFDVARVREALAALLGRPLPYAGLPFERFVPLGDDILFSFESRDYRLNKRDHTIVQTPAATMIDQMFGGAARAQPRLFERPNYWGDRFPCPAMPSPDGQRLVGLQGHNIVLHYPADRRAEPLTDDGELDNEWDVEGPRFRPGTGGSLITSMISPWAPDGLRLFAARFDARKVGKFTRTHVLKRYDEVEEKRVTRSGDPIVNIQPYVIDVLQRQPIRIDVPGEDHFLIFLGWRSDGGELYFAQFSRDVHEAYLYAADPRTGAARMIHHERGETFIRIQHDVINGRAGCAMLGDGSGFIWESQRDGWNHLYRYDMDGTLVGQLTEGDWPVLDVIAVDLGTDPEGGQVYFTAHHDPARLYDVHLCRVPLTGGVVERLTEKAAVHEIQIAPDFKSFVATHSLPYLPPQSEVRRTDGTLVHSFAPADISSLEKLGWTPPEQFSVKAADDVTDLWGVIYKPANFDPTKTYPVLEYIYGGPQIIYTAHNFLIPPGHFPYAALPAALPQLDYVVVVLDARGTPGRSKAFQDVVYKEWRRHVTADHATAIRTLGKDRLWMDMDRVGLYGHSWGGTSTIIGLMDEPELFKAGVASAPGTDPHDIFIYEPYLGGVPGPDNIAAYRDLVLYPDAARVVGKLMIVCGTSDLVPWPNAVKMTNALILAGVDHEFVMLPGENHGFTSGHERYFIRKLVDHFDRALKPAG